MPSTILVVGAHPDDEILGGGATFARHVDNGDEVHALVCSEGASARYADPMQSELRAASEASAKAIGFATLQHLSLPDQKLDTLALIEITQMLEETVQQIRPDIVYTHSAVDVNNDHGVVARALWTACRPYATPFVRRFLAFETPSSTEWAWPTTDTTFIPQIFTDIEKTLERKLSAMACYSSELRDYPHPRSIRALRNRAEYWGSKVGVPAAEAFTLLRCVQ